ncbi:MAG: response regulator [Bdellovibrionota bacterium]
MKTILIVEDDQAIRDTLRLALEFEGFQVRSAADGREGLTLLATMPRPDLILLDLMMPVMDGWAFVDALQANPELSGIPVVVETAFNDRDRPIRAKETIRKPIDLDDLSTVVRKYCG